ncbi:signal peptidase I [Halobellus captivus]|uniref:signal peptidase I n=1 Tax=Halobellus captivus TaxID=2592614 RepID=UPI0011A0F380|nr:signal peptidase I [Halobellus captivus]
MGRIDRAKLRTAANVLGVLLLIAVVVPFLVYGFPQLVGADHGFVVLSGSMEPAMSPGDAIIVREASADEIEERDIITYRTDSETPTTHRVIDVIDEGGSVAYATKGDANEDADPGRVEHEQVIGEVLFVIPLLGYVVRLVNTPVGFAALVIAPMLLFTLSELRALIRSTHARTDPEAHSPEIDSAADTKTDGEASFTLTTSSIQLLTLVFALYLPYSAYVAYLTKEAWSIAAAVATGIALLFAAGLYAGSLTEGGTVNGADTADDAEGSVPDSAAHSVEADGGEQLSTDSDGESRSHGSTGADDGLDESVGRDGTTDSNEDDSDADEPGRSAGDERSDRIIEQTARSTDISTFGAVGPTETGETEDD